MKTTTRFILTLGAVAMIAGSAFAQAQRSTPQPRRGSAENSLLGIALFDTGLRVISRFGSPDEILAVTAGGGGQQGGGGGGGSELSRGGPSAAGNGGAGGGGRGGGGGGSAMTPQVGFAMPISDNDPLPGFAGDPFTMALRRQAGVAPEDSVGAPVSAGQGPGAAGGRGGEAGSRGGSPAGAGGAGGGGAGQSERVTLTRWVYNRKGARYAFVLDKFNRVVQIEAIGLYDSAPRTRRGIRFGSNFSSIIRSYNAPDGYEISGSNIVVRYLVMDRVAFRLQKVDPKKPHVVTGIVVAAGKA